MTTCRRLRLNSFRSDLCLILMPASQSLDASVSIAENIKLNSVGARTQPCVTPLETGKDSDGSPSSRTRACMPSLNWRTMVMNLWGQPNLLMIFHNPSLLTVSKALVRSTKVVRGHSAVPYTFLDAGGR